MFVMKTWIVVFIPVALAQDLADPSISKVVQQSATMGGDGMDGPMQIPVAVAGSRHFSKQQIARGTDSSDDDAVSASSLLAVPFFAMVLCAGAYFLIATESGRDIAKSFGLIAAENGWSKMEVVSSKDDHAKWVRMALEAPLVQQAMNAMGMKGAREPDITEMNAFMGNDRPSEDWKPSTMESCRKSAMEKLQQASQAEPLVSQEDFMECAASKTVKEEDDFDPNSKAGANEDLLGAEPEQKGNVPEAEDEPIAPKQTTTDLLGKEEEDDAPKEFCFDPIAMESSTTDVAPTFTPDEDDTTAAFMANRGNVSMSPEELLKSLSAPVISQTPIVPETPVEAAPASVPVVEAAPVEKVETPSITKVTAGFTLDDDELLGDFNAPAPVPVAFDPIKTAFNFDDDDF